MTYSQALQAVFARLDALETLIKAIQINPDAVPDLIALDTRIQTLTGQLQAKTAQG